MVPVLTKLSLKFFDVNGGGGRGGRKGEAGGSESRLYSVKGRA